MLFPALPWIPDMRCCSRLFPVWLIRFPLGDCLPRQFPGSRIIAFPAIAFLVCLLSR